MPTIPYIYQLNQNEPQENNNVQNNSESQEKAFEMSAAPDSFTSIDKYGDDDMDRIKNEDDQCKNNPENYNAYMDDDGCPDEIPKEIIGHPQFDMPSILKVESSERYASIVDFKDQVRAYYLEGEESKDIPFNCIPKSGSVFKENVFTTVSCTAENNGFIYSETFQVYVEAYPVEEYQDPINDPNDKLLILEERSNYVNLFELIISIIIPITILIIIIRFTRKKKN